MTAIGSPAENDDLVAVLLTQHGQIRSLCSAIATARADARSQAFKKLQAVLTAHEASEQAILRPMTLETAGESTVGDRGAEERAIRTALLDLARLPTASAEFEVRFSHLSRLVAAHLEAEEREEFPHLLAHYDSAERQVLGRRFIEGGRLAPTAPGDVLANPTAARIVLRPLAALVQRTKDIQRSGQAHGAYRPTGDST